MASPWSDSIEFIKEKDAGFGHLSHGKLLSDRLNNFNTNGLHQSNLFTGTNIFVEELGAFHGDEIETTFFRDSTSNHRLTASGKHKKKYGICRTQEVHKASFQIDYEEVMTCRGRNNGWATLLSPSEFS